jgi:predicted HD phosphohydrolase
MSDSELPGTTFTRMQDGTREDYALIARHELALQGGLPDRLLAGLAALADHSGGYAVDRLTHSLQSATRALRDGRDDEYVACALIHDIGDGLAPANHSELAGAIVKPFVSEKNHWIVKHHGIFQGYYFFHHFGLDRNMRDRYRDHAFFDDCAEFCANYDQNCFDPEYDTLPLTHFEPLVRDFFGKPRRPI